MDADRALDRAEGVVEAADEVGGRRELLEQVRLLERRQPLGEVRGPPVVGVRLPVRLERRGTARGDERVLAHHVLVAGGLRVVHDVGGVGAGGQRSAPRTCAWSCGAARRSGCSTGPRCAPARGGSARRLPAISSSCRRSGSSAATGQPGISSSSTAVAHAVRHDRDELDETARGVVEPGDARRARRWPPTAAAPRRRARRAAR